MDREFTVRSSPTYRSLEVVLPSAHDLRRQQQELATRRGEVLRDIGQELRAAMAQGHDSCILHFPSGASGWRERALLQAGYDVQRMSHEQYGPDRFLIYFGDRNATERALLNEDMLRPDGAPVAPSMDTFVRGGPPSPSVYTRSIYIPPSPPPTQPPIAPVPSRPPFDRAQTVPGPEYRSAPQRPERGVAFDQDVRGGNYTPRPGQRF